MSRTLAITLMALGYVLVAAYALQVAIDANHAHLNKVLVQTQLNNP